MAATPQYNVHDYTVAWLCALPTHELGAAREMLDNEHQQPVLNNRWDGNHYFFGEINQHKVVIACLPPGMPGITSANTLIQPLKQSFPNLIIHLFVGIGGGIPRNPRPKDANEDIHLGDVVVGWSERAGVPAVVQYDFFRSRGTTQEPELLSRLDKPDSVLVKALVPMTSDRHRGQSTFHRHLEQLATREKYQHPGFENDLLFEADCSHRPVDPSANDCRNCGKTAERPVRANKIPQFHLGTVLSGNRIIEDSQERDRLSRTNHNAICFEMEAAGAIDYTHCLVIRGISDYADSHRVSLAWYDYAAASAAAFAKELLCVLRPAQLQTMRPQDEDVKVRITRYLEQGKRLYKRYQSNERLQDLHDLYNASHCLQQARDDLIEAKLSDPKICLQVYFRLTTIETDLSHDGNIRLHDQLEHIHLARDYATQALSYAKDENGASAQVRLEQAIVKGRYAELEVLKHTRPTVTSRMKEEAQDALVSARKELKARNIEKSHEYEKRVQTWLQRLSRN